MNKKIHFFFIFFISVLSYGQNQFTGTVRSEENAILSKVLIINMKTEAKTFSDNDGRFVIEANISDEIRFSKNGFERLSITFNALKNPQNIEIILKKIPIPIEEVKITYKPTGNLKEDLKHYGDNKKTGIMKGELLTYIKQKSDKMILQPKAGEFVQPVGQGFSIGKSNNKWDIIDFYENLITSIGKEYFNSIPLKNEELYFFFNFALKDFDTQHLRKYGYISSSELSKIQMLMEKSIEPYKMLKK